jgi:UDP-3-O-[3-hydroxymyristoyl] N-acetylglucosamine deacetylase
VATVEHCLAALAGLGVDNAMIEIDGPELPILDGSARASSSRRSIRSASCRCRQSQGHQGSQAGPHRERPLLCRTSSGWLHPALDVEIAFDTAGDRPSGPGVRSTAERFRSEISAARTFGFMRDVEKLWKAGFALGASLENTVAIGEDKVVNPGGPALPDEFVRHKILDAVGDLSLAGLPIRGTYRAFCPGHKLNVMMLEQLFADRSAYAIVDAGDPPRDGA